MFIYLTLVLCTLPQTAHALELDPEWPQWQESAGHDAKIIPPLNMDLNRVHEAYKPVRCDVCGDAGI